MPRVSKLSVRSNVSLIVTYLCLIGWVQGSINVARTDTNRDIVLYLNGMPLRALGSITIPQYTQTKGIVLSNGQRIPAYQNGVTNIRISVARLPYNANGLVLRGGGGGGIGEQPVVNNYYYGSSTPSGPYGNGVGYNYDSLYGPVGYSNGFGSYGNGIGSNYGSTYSPYGYGNTYVPNYGTTTGYRQKSGFEQFLDSINIFRQG